MSTSVITATRTRALTVLLVLASTLLHVRSEEVSADSVPPPLKPGQHLDPRSTYARTWPGRPGLFKINDQLVLAIPPQFQQFWLQRHWLTGIDPVARPPTRLADLHTVKVIAFSFHLPDFSGFTPENYEREFDPTRVEVTMGAAPMSSIEPGAAGYYPPNSMQRLLQYRVVSDSYEVMHDMNCYRMRNGDPGYICYGQRSSMPDEFILLDVLLPPYRSFAVFPLMRTTYFSPKYGGVEISWRTHASNFEKWRAIDQAT